MYLTSRGSGSESRGRVTGRLIPSLTTLTMVKPSSRSEILGDCRDADCQPRSDQLPTDPHSNPEHKPCPAALYAPLGTGSKNPICGSCRCSETRAIVLDNRVPKTVNSTGAQRSGAASRPRASRKRVTWEGVSSTVPFIDRGSEFQTRRTDPPDASWGKCTAETTGPRPGAPRPFWARLLLTGRATYS